MKILYITASTPWGKGETFILEELLEVKHQGVDLLIVPRNPSKKIFHKKAKEVLENAVWLPMINFRMIAVFCLTLLTKITFWKILLVIVKNSRSLLILAKNLAILPKGTFVAKMINRKNIEHIHSHWGSTTATMAYVVSQLTGVPWSLTLHRWDIKENNMLKEKIKSARFARCISKHGERELLKTTNGKYKEKIKIIHMGVKVPKNIPNLQKSRKLFRIVTPANLLEVKGHKYLIEACRILVKQGVKNFRCFFYGEGPLKIKLKNSIKKKKLDNYIKMCGVIPHEKLIEMYRNKKIDMVILPSIITSKGEHEGIPVALMEAMTYGIPVVSTNTGGIPELLSNNCGIIVEQKSPEKLADAIKKLVSNGILNQNIIKNSYQKIKKDFDITKNVKLLLKVITEKQFEEKYNWGSESKKLLKIYEKFIEK